MTFPRRCACVWLSATVLTACSPTLDWRDVRPAGSGITLQFPCRPSSQQRQVALAGPPVALVLSACSAGGLTWGLAHADVADPARVGPALVALVAAAAANVGAAGGLPLGQPARVPGATPNAAGGRWVLRGRLPDGVAVQMQVLVFAQGTRVFQATALGPQVPDDAAQNYFASIRAGR